MWKGLAREVSYPGPQKPRKMHTTKCTQPRAEDWDKIGEEVRNNASLSRAPQNQGLNRKCTQPRAEDLDKIGEEVKQCTHPGH